MAKPTNRYKEGAVEVTEWTNSGKNGEFKTFTIQRTYKDGEEFKQTNSMKLEDLVKLKKAIDLAINANK